MMLFPVLARRFGTVNLICGGAVMGIVCYAIHTLGSANLGTLPVGSLLGTMAVLPISAMINIYLIYCIAYKTDKIMPQVRAELAEHRSGVQRRASPCWAAMPPGELGTLACDKRFPDARKRLAEAGRFCYNDSGIPHNGRNIRR